MTRRRTNLTPELVQDAIKMLEAGKSKKAILRELKISPATSGRISQAMRGVERPDNENIRALMAFNKHVAAGQKKDTHGLSVHLLDASKALSNFKKTVDAFEARLVELDDFLAEIHKKAKEIRNLL